MFQNGVMILGQTTGLSAFVSFGTVTVVIFMLQNILIFI